MVVRVATLATLVLGSQAERFRKLNSLADLPWTCQLDSFGVQVRQNNSP